MKLPNHLFLSLIFLCWITLSPIQARKPNGHAESGLPLDPPLAAFTASDTEGCTPFTVQFNDQSSNNPTSWSWTFEGGSPSTSTQQNPTVVYLNPGVYSVTLTVSNASGSDTLVQQNYISALGPPVAAFDASTNLDSLFLTNNSTDADSYLWNFGDGNIDTSPNPLPHIYTQDGTYTVSLTATNACGSNTTSTQITIITPPTAAFMANPSEGCVPLNVQFIDQSSSNSSNWDWTFEGGSPASSNEQNPIVNYLNPGTYGVTLTVSNAAGSHTLVQETYIVVSINPTADFETTINLDTLFLSNNSSNASSYLWDFGDGTTDTSANPPPHIYTQDGAYTVTLTAINSCSNHTISFPITIATPPTAGFFAIPTEGCVPLIVQFVDESSDNAMNWSWTFEGGEPATSDEKTPLVTYLNPGTYGVTLVTSNSVGSDTLIQETYIHASDIPTASFDTTIILDILFLTNNSTNADTYLWIFGDGDTDTSTNPIAHIYAQDGIYTLILIATNICGSDTASIPITIATPPSAYFVADPTEGCVPFQVQFSDLSSENTTSWNWTFEGGEPATSTEQNPLVSYLSPGIYGVTLTVSNSTGSNTYMQEAYITALDIPTASFDASINLDTIFLNDNSTNANSYLWIFGDGNTDSTANPGIHVYEQDGTYTVLLITTNSCGSDTASTQITIATPPTAQFAADPAEGCVPFQVQFSDLSSENTTSWSWTFEGGEPATSTEPNPLVSYLQPGTYGVTLVASNSTGSDTLVQQTLITADAFPSVDFTFVINGTMVSFTSNVSNANTLVWSFGDGDTTTEANPDHNYVEGQTYLVQLTAENDCGQISVEQEIYIPFQGPTALFESDVQSGCPPLEVQFSNLSSENTDSIVWHFPGGEPEYSNLENPTVSYNQAGSYEVTLIAFNDYGSDTLTLPAYITALDVPQVNFDYVATGAIINFQNTSLDADSYLWNFGNGDSSTEVNPTYTYDQIGTYTVTLTASNSCGENSISIELDVQAQLPFALFEADITTACAPFQVQFTDLSQEYPTAWEWTFEGGTPATSTEQNPIVTYNTPGTYSVTLFVSNPAGSNMLVQNGYIHVLGTPSADFTYVQNDLTLEFESTNLGADTYFWDFGDGQSSNLMNPTHTYAGGGSYTVTLTVGNSCGQASSSQTILLTTATSDPAFTTDWLLYPNPNDGRFVLEYSGELLPFDLQVFNLQGRELTAFRQMQAGAGTAAHFQLHALPSGTYLLKLTAENKTAYFKMVVE